MSMNVWNHAFVLVGMLMCMLSRRSQENKYKPTSEHEHDGPVQLLKSLFQSKASLSFAVNGQDY